MDTSDQATHFPDEAQHPDAVEDMHDESTRYLRPTVAGTIAIIGSILLTLPFLDTGNLPSENATAAAYLIGIGIGVSVLFDWRMGLRNLVRADIICLTGFYFLTFFEFLFPQPDFDQSAVNVHVITAIHLCGLGIAGIALGRHLFRPHETSLTFLRDLRLPKEAFLYILLFCFFIAHLHMFLAVHFNPVEWVDELMGPRFSQAWSRGRLGSWSTLLNELFLLSYVVPPLAGLILYRRKDYPTWMLVVAMALFFLQLFVGFCGGTRNVLAIYLAGFLGGHFITQPKIRLKPLAAYTAIAGGVFYFASDHMVNFREMGLSRYIEYGIYKHDTTATGFREGKTYFVDYNLMTISFLVEKFPEMYPYMGSELYFIAATKPIPRAIWPDKPMGLPVNIEEVLGLRGMTVSSTFVGESYLAGGPLAVALTALVIGAACGWWNRLGGLDKGLYSMLVFAVGVSALLITMRSVMFFTTFLLPTIALIVLAKFVLADRFEAEEGGA